METLMQDLRYALRSLGRRPGYTLAAVVTLGLGVGATVGVFSVVEGVLLRPLPFEDADRLVVFGHATAETEPGTVPRISTPDFRDYRAEAQSFEGMALFEGRLNAPLTGMGDPSAVWGAAVSPDFFQLLGAVPVLGRTFVEGDRGGIIISHDFWQERFGGAPDVLDRMVPLGGERPQPIVGVMPPGFAFPERTQLYRPINLNNRGCGRDCARLTALGRLRPDVSLAEARAELEAIARRLEAEHPATNAGVSVRMEPLMDHVVGKVRRTLYILLAAGAMVMLIACATVANLVLVQGAGRSAELALRTTLGASRRRLVRQLMTESLLLGAAGAGFGVLLAVWGVEVMRAFMPPDVPRGGNIGINDSVLTFAVFLAVMTTLLFGLLPAYRLAGTAPADALRSGGRGSVAQGARWGRFAMPVVQVALAFTLLLGAGLLLRTLTKMHDVDLGFDPAGLAFFTVMLGPGAWGEEHGQYYEELRHRLEMLPGVEAAGVLLPSPHNGRAASITFTRTDAPAGWGLERSIGVRFTDDGGMRALGLALVEGRLFRPDDRPDSQPVVIINASAARRYWPDGHAVGRQVRLISANGGEDQARTVIGVVADARTSFLIQAPEPEMYIPYGQVPVSVVAATSRILGVTVGLRSSDPSTSLLDAQRVLVGMDPNFPMAMADRLEQQRAGTRFYLALIGIFAGLSAVLASVGLYGVLAFSVGQRDREIGVRRVLGARPRKVVLMVLGQGLVPALVGLIIGIVGAITANRLIASMLYGVTPHDPATFIGVSVLLLVVACCASLIPAWRASRIPPESALRGE